MFNKKLAMDKGGASRRRYFDWETAVKSDADYRTLFFLCIVTRDTEINRFRPTQNKRIS